MNEVKDKIKLLIGLEIHITLNSKKKIFNWKKTYSGTESPNNEVSPWELGYPGYLPIINPETIKAGLSLSAALKMSTSNYIVFDRKMYNYFDLPKGYQITQNKFPFATKGFLPLITEKGTINVPIRSFHLEEDTAKSIYCSEGIKLDFNRSGNPLIELVTEPIFQEVNTVIVFIKQLQTLLLVLDISEAKMEKGQLRIDINYSLKINPDYCSPRYEIKNLNSLSNIKIALQKEIEKHLIFFEKKQNPPESSTLNFDERNKCSKINRKKEEYFFLPEFNIPPIKISEQNKKKAVKNLPYLLPWKYWKFVKNLESAKLIEIVQHPNFFLILKTLNFLIQRKLKIIEEIFVKWANFCFNYLQDILQNDLKKFKKRWKKYLNIFYEWVDKKKDKETIREEIQNIQKKRNLLIPKDTKNEKDNDNLNDSVNNNIKEKLNFLWSDKIKETLNTNFQKVFNYLLGSLRREYNDINVAKLVKELNNFLDQKK